MPVTGLVRNGIDTPEYPCKREYESRNTAGSRVVALISPDSVGAASASSGTTCRSDCVLLIRPTKRRDPGSGFTVAAETADTIGEGHAEAGHDQSGNVGGRGSTVPRLENPSRPARQAVPPLRQARRVLHALYLEATGQPGTAPRPLLPVPSRGARRFAELWSARRVDLDAGGAPKPPPRPGRHGQRDGQARCARSKRAGLLPNRLHAAQGDASSAPVDPQSHRHPGPPHVGRSSGPRRRCNARRACDVERGRRRRRQQLRHPAVQPF